MWIHDGVSVGESLSLSLAFNIDLPLELLFQELGRQLTGRRDWWNPIPIGPLGHPETSASLGLEEEINGYFDRLLDLFGNRPFRRQVKAAWWEKYRSAGRPSGSM